MSVHLPITIGDNVWICGSVTIVPRVTIGDNTIIGAGSVGEKTNLANVIAAGVHVKLSDLSPQKILWD